MSTPEERFYADLPAVTRFVDLVAPEAYHDAPPSWHIIVTDIIGSTKAIEAGRYKDVNVLGAASIIAVTNAIGTQDIPFVFGGDGATMLVSSEALPAATRALGGLAVLAEEAFALQLRIGAVHVGDLQDDGHAVQVTKFALSNTKSLAMLWGSGVQQAERLIKNPETTGKYAIPRGDSSDVTNLDGLSCRWEPLGSRHGQMLTLIALATAPTAKAALDTYRRVVDFLEEVLPNGRPADSTNIKMGKDRGAFRTEATLLTRSTGGFKHWVHRTWITFETWAARGLIKRGTKLGGFDGTAYPETLVRHTDFRKFDGALRIVLDVTPQQSARIEKFLSDQHAAGTLVYGVHHSNHALMTCVVQNYDDDHIHFIDGADGGYALAAKQLKAQLKEMGEH